MADSWNDFLLEDLAAPIRNAIVGGPFGSNLVSNDYVESGVPVVRGQNMGGRWIGGDFAFVSAEKADSLSGNLARPGDLIFTQRGTLGQVALIPQGEYDRYLVSQSQMKATIDRSRADAKFLYYYFSSEVQQDWIKNNAIQTGVPHTNLGILRKHPVQLPPLLEQQSIAVILGTLDDKIEQNRRTSQALEALAQATFKAWFVDFEPVKAKAAGQTSFPGMSAYAFAALPNRFTDSPLGPVPKGWSIRRLESLLTLRYGKSLPKTRRVFGAVPVYGSGGITGAHTDALVKGPGIIVGRKGSIGTIYWERDSFFPIDTTYYVEPRGEVGLHYLHDLLGTLRLNEMNTDAAVPGLNRENVYRLEVVFPDELWVNYFETFRASLRNMSGQLDMESRKLAELRDYLLPRLLSGQVRVSPEKVEAQS